MKHIKINEDRLISAVKENMFGCSSVGFCLACGAEREGCEPDARKYPCEECGENMVYGAEEVMIMQVG